MVLKKRFIVGCMTGTSIDGLDVALVEINGSGLELSVSIKRCLSRSLKELDKKLHFIAQNGRVTAKEFTQISLQFAHLHISAIKELTKGERIDLIAIHGQTVYHNPPLSLQMINPTPVAIELNSPVVTDLRASDLAMGGQGAPITPISDFILFRSSMENRSVINLGGFCNVQTLPKTRCNKNELQPIISRITGQDICLCNQLLDSISRKFFNTPFDPDGINSFKGNVKEKPFADLLSILKNQAKSGRSLGSDDEIYSDWIKEYQNHYSGEDLGRTACAAIATTIVSKCNLSDRIILAGGGAKNKTLVKEISNRSNIPVVLSDEESVPAIYREAVSMAILGALCQDRVPITLPQITGSSSAKLSGVWVLP